MTHLCAGEGDLTAQDVEAIVNAANEHLAHGGGVAAAIARAGGPTVQAESDRWVADNGPVAPGTAAVTTAGELPARRIIHVVGPRYRSGQDNEGLLVEAVTAALDTASEIGARSLAFPAISAGIFGYPPDEATRVIAATVTEWTAQNPDALDEVRLVGLDAAITDLFRVGLAAAP